MNRILCLFIAIIALLSTSSTKAATKYDGEISALRMTLTPGDTLRFTSKSQNILRQIVEVGIASSSKEGISWSILLNNTDTNNRLTCKIESRETNVYDFDHSEYIRISVVYNDTTLMTKDINSDVNLSTHPNYLIIDTDAVSTSLSFGDKEPVKICTFMVPGFYDEISLTACFPSELIRRSIIYIPDGHYISSGLNDKDVIMAATKNTKDSKCGIWKYLDRETDSDYSIPGGYYTLALINNDNGYDIIYVDGAKTNKTRWTTGIIKGSLTRTRFADNFDLKWIDATGEIVSEECYATFDGDIMTLVFPLDKARLRFVKSLKETHTN